MQSINFITKKSNCIFNLELSKSLLHFMEYDFSYFWEQTIVLGKESKDSNSFSIEQSANLRDLISKCHPYFDALSKSDYSEIVLDCIIEHICRTENIGLEALWNSCITPKNSYEKAIFKRISEYKINHACNQWVTIMRLQEYARVKAAFVFDGDICSPSEAKARAKYFDLTYSVAASESGFPIDETTGVMRFNPAQIPNAVFVVSKTAKQIYKRISSKIDDIPMPSKRQINDTLRDSYALDAFDYMKEITRPEQPEMFSAIENFRDLPDVVYLPNSFKAIIDLEIEEMLSNGIMLLKCQKCGRYFNRRADYNGLLCDRVNSSGKSCREQAQDEETEMSAHNVEIKSEKLYTYMHSKVGKEIPSSEFNEWSNYLVGLRKNVVDKNATVEELNAFLQYTEKMYGELKQ